MSRIYIDFEFLEDGKTIDPISVGLVGPDERDYYAVNWDAPWDKVFTHDFLSRNVCPHLPLRPEVRAWWKPGQMSYFHTHTNANSLLDQDDASVKPKWVIANEVREFILGYPNPKLWGDEPCFDHVALAWLFGDMTRWPFSDQFSTYNIQQDLDGLGNPELDYDISHLRPHHALDDARGAKIIHEAALRYIQPMPFIPPQEPPCPT